LNPAQVPVIDQLVQTHCYTQLQHVPAIGEGGLFIEMLPFKVELHAHLHGCIRLDTLLELAAKNNTTYQIQDFIKDPVKNLASCFKVFDAIHSLVRDRETLLRVTVQVICDFAMDHVIYLELRATPRQVKNGFTKKQYVETLLEGVQIAKQKHNIHVKLLLSVNRSHSIEQAEENIKLASMFKPVVVGVDFSGNPFRNHFVDFLPILHQARREYGLKITIHCGEIDNDQEVKAILNFKPDRLGHVLVLGEELNDLVLASKIPIEVCPSSNCKTLNIRTVAEHPMLEKWLELNHPLVICTDDKGIFQTSLSNEYHKVATAFNLSSDRMRQLHISAVNHCFCSLQEKDEIVAIMTTNSSCL